ncbi:phosphatase PAP2 family protein [Bdellovibrionota bacterium FG-2]
MSTISRTLESIFYIDQISLRWIANRRHPITDRLMRGLTHAGDWQRWTTLILASFLAGEPFRHIANLITPKLLLTLALCYAIKTISKRPRPVESMHGFSSLLKDPDPYSFPSSHSACAWAVCMSLALMFGGGWSLLCLYAAAISYSRVHVGAHYPLDVLIGSALGILIASIF